MFITDSGLKHMLDNQTSSVKGGEVLIGKEFPFFFVDRTMPELLAAGGTSGIIIDVRRIEGDDDIFEADMAFATATDEIYTFHKGIHVTSVSVIDSRTEEPTVGLCVATDIDNFEAIQGGWFRKTPLRQTLTVIKGGKNKDR